MKKTWMRRARMRRGKRNNMYTNLSLGYSSSSPVQYWQNDSQHWPNSFLLPLPLPRHLLRPLLRFLPLPLPLLLPHCHHHPENNVFHINISNWYFKLIFQINISWWYLKLVFHIDITYWYYILILHIDITYWYFKLILHIDIWNWYYILILHIDISNWYFKLILFQYIIKMSFQKNYDLRKYFYGNEKQINHWSKVWQQKQQYTGK